MHQMRTNVFAILIFSTPPNNKISNYNAQKDVEKSSRYIDLETGWVCIWRDLDKEF